MLDRIRAPRVFLGANTEVLPVKRNENNLEFQTKRRGDVRLVEDSMAPREDKEKGGITKTIYYAKAGRSENRRQTRFGAGTTAPYGNALFSFFSVSHCPKAKSPLSARPSGRSL